jgi:hypothetical protein
MDVAGKVSLATLAAVITACGVNHQPSGRGYDYDHGWTMARGDVGVDARRLASLSHQVEANCGFTIKYAYGDPPADIRAVEFAEGYNSVSVPIVEKRLEVNISEALERCVKKTD